MTDIERSFLGRGWSFPVQPDAERGHIATAENEEDIAQSIRIILETAPGERVMRPDFGCGIHDLVFQSLDATTLGDIKASVETALRRFESRVVVLAVDVAQHEAERGVLRVEIRYRVRDTNHEFNLVFPFYLKEGLER